MNDRCLLVGYAVWRKLGKDFVGVRWILVHNFAFP